MNPQPNTTSRKVSVKTSTLVLAGILPLTQSGRYTGSIHQHHRIKVVLVVDGKTIIIQSLGIPLALPVQTAEGEV